MFHKGDKVICVMKNEWVPAGTVGTVLENSDVPFVRWENGETWALRSVDMKNYDDTDKTKEIEVGDRVRLIDTNNNYYWESWKLPKGAKGTIMAIRKYGSYTVRWDNWHHGHDGDISDIKDSSCLFISEDAVELLPKGKPEQKDKTKEIEVGDRVKLIDDTYSVGWKLPNGAIGTVMSINDTDKSYTVRWDNWHHGHNGCIYYIDDHSCLFVKQDEVKLIAKGKPEQKEEPKYNIVLFRQGNKVIAKMTEGKKVINTTEAKCSPEDTFNFFIGSQIALQRLMAEQVEDYEDIRYPVPETTGMREFLLY